MQLDGFLKLIIRNFLTGEFFKVTLEGIELSFKIVDSRRLVSVWHVNKVCKRRFY